MRYLSDLIGDDIDRRRIRKGWRDLDVVGITSDSRLVRPGFVFAAIEGAKQDGREFIGDAVKNGARAILTQSLPEDYDVVPVPVLYTQNVRYSLAKMAARFYEVQPRWVTAVTGTDGKTSVANFYKQIWQLLGEASASIGTLGIHSQAELPREYPALNTTPDPVILHQALADLARAGVHHVAMEASSIGLDQNRLDGVRVRVAGYTNFTRDHLDYHKTELAYLHAKMGLFTRVLEGGGMAVLNVDDPYFSAFRHHCKRLGHRIMGYGKDARDLTLLSVTPHATGQKVKLKLFDHEMTVDIPLLGEFQIMNILCAVGMALASGATPEQMDAVLPKLEGVPGRMEHVATHKGAPIFVDYAHTPGGLEGVLKHLRPHVKGRIVLVFGCGGDRDRGKRPQMGEIAAQYADQVFVTDDNPRTENPLLIRKDVLAGCPDAEEIGDRKEAIEAAINTLKKGDALLIAGKGHEKMQIIGTVSHPFDDAQVARQATGKKPKQ